MPKRKEDRSPDEFWREYEEKFSEKVLIRGLGRYISGYEEFDSKEWNNLWGLIVFSTGGFRFHHFPQQNWLKALTIRGDTEGSKEKIIFIPNEKIISADIMEETRWWVKVFSSVPPLLTIHFRDEAENEKTLRLETEIGSKEMAEKLKELRFS